MTYPNAESGAKGYEPSGIRKMRKITITHSPCPDDETPFSYEEEGFVRWVDEVFLEGWKTLDASFPPFEECLSIIEGAGYLFKVVSDAGTWVQLEKDTDCCGCHYTIREDNEEGMYLVGAKHYCMVSCYQEHSS